MSEIPYVLSFEAIGAADLPAVGGKGANLGELARAGLPVPPGFCVTTRAWRAHLAGDTHFDRLLDRLSALDPDDLEGTRALGAGIRSHIESRAMPGAIAEAITDAWQALDLDRPLAVRSSATAEDLPSASFAGQQDTWLNVVGRDALLDRVRACWASLYTDRAILYRRRNAVPHRGVAIAIVVQRMVRPSKSGILFTADPLTGHRGHTRVDAGFGLGEALVSGLVDADDHLVETATGRVLRTAIGDKRLAIEPIDGGGTRHVELPPELRRARVLSDDELTRLVDLGRRIATHYDTPQDIEWCIEGTTIHIVQARPITSLYPCVEPPSPGGGPAVWACFNHFQVMTDAMSPMAVDIWRRALPFGRPPDEPAPGPWSGAAGGRMYLDVAPLLRRPPLRRMLLGLFEHVDRRARAELAELARRPGFADGPAVRWSTVLRFLWPKAREVVAGLLWRDPAAWRTRIERWTEAHVAAACRAIERADAPAAAVEAIIDTFARLVGPMFDVLPPAVLVGQIAERRLRALVGPAHAADVTALGRGLAGNVTTEMDLAVGDLADIARARPAVAAALRDGVLDRAPLAALALSGLDGGPAFLDALDGFLDAFGSRGPSEIDIARPRWRDAPGSVLQAIAGNLSHGEAGAHRTHHARLVAEAEAAGDRLVAAAAAHGPALLAPVRRRRARRLVALHRRLSGLREHPKFAIVRVLDAARAALLRVGADRVAAGALAHPEDIWMLTLAELRAALRDGRDLRPLAAERRAAHARHAQMAPPRIMTDTGEIPSAPLDAPAPDGTLVGSPASGGLVEGIARVVRDPHTETLHKGEILVAPFTDPGWTPLFINAAGLVMEVGGRMTHGSVVAREYGLPAVVNVPGATTTLRTGQRVRVDGDRGWVTVLDDSSDGIDTMPATAGDTPP